MGEQLKPCPFCGCKAELITSSDLDGLEWHWIECKHLYAKHRASRDLFRDRVINDWNRRAPSPAIKEMVEALEACESAIRSLPVDALGMADAVDVHSEPYQYPIRDALLGRIEAALSAFRKETK